MTKSETPQYLLDPFRVVHNDGNVVAGFKDEKSAAEDAADRTERAKALGLSCTYKAIEK